MRMYTYSVAIQLHTRLRFNWARARVTEHAAAAWALERCMTMIQSMGGLRQYPFTTFVFLRWLLLWLAGPGESVLWYVSM